MKRVPDSRAAERIASLYEDNALEWDRQRGRDLIERGWLERFAALLLAGGHVLDLGCGSSEPIARWLIERGCRVTGIDTSKTLIALCRKRFAGQRWLVADMRSLDLGRRFDGILAWHSLFHLTPDDQRAMFPRFAALAATGAPLMFTSGPEAGETVGEWQGEPLYHAGLAPADYEALLSASGFELRDRRVRDAGCGDATVWLARRM